MDKNSSIEWDIITEKFFQNGLSILRIIMRSISNKLSELFSHLLIINKKFTHIILTETRLNAECDVGLELHGYRFSAVYRTNKRGGGIKLYY